MSTKDISNSDILQELKLKQNTQDNIKEIILTIPTSKERLYVYVPSKYENEFMNILEFDKTRNSRTLKDENKLYEFFNFLIQEELKTNLQSRIEDSYQNKVYYHLYNIVIMLTL